ncbi:Xaa-Pro dipeptidase [soil metagenome]
MHPTLADLHRTHVTSLQSAYERILSDTGQDAILIHGGSIQLKTNADDQYWPLRATPHFQHWLALSEAEAALLVRPGKKPLLLRPSEVSFWESPAPLPGEFLLESFEVHRYPSWESLKSLLPARTAFVGDAGARAAILGIEAVNDKELVKKLDALRVEKTAYEVACLAEANRIAARGHDRVRDAFFGGETSELALHLAYLSATSQDDPETPYKNIVALGRHAATLHHVTYAKDASGAPSLLLDAGATYFGYCSDVTRTWLASGSGAGASTFRGMLEAADAMQQRLVAGATVGRKYESLHDESHREVSKILHDTKLVRLSIDEIDAKGISRAFYPHGLGHSLGLQCHDVGCATSKPRADNPFLRNTEVIAKDQVFTIEPGIYFIEPLLQALRAEAHGAAVDWVLLDALTPFGGIRIEDDVVVRAEGPVRNLTREALKPTSAG